MRIYKIYVGTCPVCGTDMELRGALQDTEGIKRYLRYIGVSEEPPHVAPPRYEQATLDMRII